MPYHPTLGFWTPKKVSGVYLLKNIHNKKVYIGATRGDIFERVKDHLRNLSGNRHKNPELQKAWNDGDTFIPIIVEELEFTDKNSWDERERYWISYYDSTDPEKGYNLESGGTTGKVIAERTLERMRISSKKAMEKQMAETEEWLKSRGNRLP